jgi:pyruvate, orthophosphate dikinase
MTKKYIYHFDEINEIQKMLDGYWEGVRGMLGGKGANLADMVRLGVPVPPGFTITTEACSAYLRAEETLPVGLWEQVVEALKKLEAATGKNLGGKENPLLVSCRSGAKFSMPGMMDTVLNLGLNDETAEGMVKLTGDERFVYDSYRRLIQMFGTVVMGVPDDAFEERIEKVKLRTKVRNEAELRATDWKGIVDDFMGIYRYYAHHTFPKDPYEQIKLAIEAVFRSWNGKRAVDYRNAAGISHDLGTAVSIVTMVFGNMGQDSATGVAMTRDGSTGENLLEGDYLVNAQGEDVVAGIRQTKDLKEMATELPEAFCQLETIARKLEIHYRDMQDMEFTIEHGKLWMLQTRNGKRTARAAVRIAVDMADEGLITRKEAVLRVSPEQVDFFLHPQFDPDAVKSAESEGRDLALGLNVSPGAACGMAVFDADLAQDWTKKGNKTVIMVRPETKPDDVHGMLAAEGILTSKGGRTSHAALVARQFGIPAVVGASSIYVDLVKRQMTVKGITVQEGDWLSVDGTTGKVYIGKIDMMIPDIQDPWLLKLLAWADEHRRLGVWANADYPQDAKRARNYGAQGIGLCRTEHMFFEADRLPLVQKMIMAERPADRKEAIDALLPFQRKDFEGLFRVMDKMPVIIRLIDPPLHEFLPDTVVLMQELFDLKLQMQHASKMEELNSILESIQITEQVYKRAIGMKEANPMLGLRGVRLGITIPDLTSMQVKAIFEAACRVAKEGISVNPKIMIPLTSHPNELKIQFEVLENVAREVMDAHSMDIDYKLGTMIEVPRAALTADKIAEHAGFFSFGTNDLTQTTFGISRDDAETGFLIQYLANGVLPINPFATIDKDGVGALMEMAVKKGRQVKPNLECGICGEHGGDPDSINFCHQLGLTYVSCSPYRVPVARLAAAHAALKETI